MKREPQRVPRPLLAHPAARLGAVALSSATAICAPMLAARADGGAKPANVVPSVFHIEKNENKNQVHYALRVDDHCVPRSDGPVYPYWRMREKGPQATEYLKSVEGQAYGIASQRVAEKTDSGGTVRLTLRPLPDRPILIRVRRDGEQCRAEAFTRIAGTQEHLSSVYVDIGFMFHVDAIELRGVRQDGTPVAERFQP